MRKKLIIAIIFVLLSIISGAVVPAMAEPAVSPTHKDILASRASTEHQETSALAIPSLANSSTVYRIVGARIHLMPNALVEQVQSYKVNQKASLDKVQTALIALNLAQAFSGPEPEFRTMCAFTPVFALRVVTDGTYDFLLDEDCGQLKIYKNDSVLLFMERPVSESSRKLRALLDSFMPQ